MIFAKAPFLTLAPSFFIFSRNSFNLATDSFVTASILHFKSWLAEAVVPLGRPPILIVEFSSLVETLLVVVLVLLSSESEEADDDDTD